MALFLASTIGRCSTRALVASSSRCNATLSESTINGSPYEEQKLEIDLSSSKEKPMKISAYGETRTIACVCDDMHFMTLKKGPPVTCKCGYWFQLVDANKFWVK